MIILFGLAGSGKGTQGRALAEIFGWRWLSVGEAIRQTNEYDDIINQGNMIPDEDVIRMMGKQIAKAEDEGFDVILDGYPRDAVQTKWILENMSGKLDGAIILEVPKEELLERLALRGRDDVYMRCLAQGATGGWVMLGLILKWFPSCEFLLFDTL